MLKVYFFVVVLGFAFGFSAGHDWSRPVEAESRWFKQSDTQALARCLERGVPVVPFGSDDQEGVFACVARVK